MANYNAKEKIEHLFDLLNKSEDVNKAEITQLIESIIYREIDNNGNYKNETHRLYNNLFFMSRSEKELSFEAYRLNINNVNSKVIILESHNVADSEYAMDILSSIADSRAGQNYVIPVGYDYLAIIYEETDGEDVKEFCLATVESLMNELGINVTVGIGGQYNNILEARKSYEEAEEALKAGKQLLGDSGVYEYERLGIAKIVYEMSLEQCNKFLNETLTPEAIKDLENKEMQESIITFFKNDLNISVAARELYVHRNTLVYRIEKFNKSSGYDLAKFEDAAVIRFALMVRRKALDDKV